jgi:hypothetical protein
VAPCPGIPRPSTRSSFTRARDPAYAEKYQNTLNLALELPTGTGKTLLGLLIGEWVRREAEGPVTYATPTKQFARQVAATAQGEGVLAGSFMLPQVRTDGLPRPRLHPCWFLPGAVMPCPAGSQVRAIHLPRQHLLRDWTERGPYRAALTLIAPPGTGEPTC